MLVTKAVQLTMLAAAAVLWGARTDAAPSAFKVCGRKLSEIMARVCHVYNSPSWDVPTVVEQPAGLVRRKRRTGGIADECCNHGCTWEQLSEYCSVSVDTDTFLADSHLIADRSAEQEGGTVSSPAVLASEGRKKATESVENRGTTSGPHGGGAGTPREVGSARNGGYGRGRGRGRRRGCWCRRKRRSGRRRASLMGNMDVLRNAARAAPVVGTVSPLLTWGRTLNTDLPQIDRDRYAYVAVYST